MGRPFTSEDARAVGLTYKQLRSSAYRRLFHDVYVDATEPDSVELRAAAIGLVLPDGAVVGLTAAAWLHGADVRDRRCDDIEVIAQRGDQIRRAGIAATSALLAPDDATEVLGIPVTTPTRTAFDLARRRDLIEAVVGIDAM
ncbi:MAG TPA: type IV toxin-antitoxin system AbiEi family antitoxin, partial [Mycobacteriales bacterium]|nr:type IV toxin-antitoxin system AbiEi family antitoxin [Mycobacteriales bacterium]